jgi:hypothetical protein
VRAAAYVGQRDRLRRFVDIAIVEEMDTYGQSLRVLNDEVWSEVPEGREYKPTLTVPEAHARALLDALSAHFQGAENTRQLRKDYDAERARVDRLIEAVTGTR